MTLTATDLLVAASLLSTHRSQPKGREMADRLQRALDAMPADCDARGAEGAVSDAGDVRVPALGPLSGVPSESIVSAAHYGRTDG